MTLRRVLQLSTLLSVAGLGISFYLTWAYLADAALVCGTSGGCATVQHSAYAWIAGIPMPMLGAVAYSLLIALAILAMQWEQRRGVALQALVGVSLVGVLFSGYLTYLEFYVIDALCRWCIASAVVVLLVCILAFVAWRQYQSE